MNRARRYAAAYLQRGWVTIPCVHREKRPDYGVTEWQDRKHKFAQERFETEFAEHLDINVGVVLGSGLVDIDLDCPEAARIAERLLPKTITFGRKSAPKSHWLYRCSAESNTFVDPIRAKEIKSKKKHKETAQDKSMILEVRSTSHYTVFPGSIHPSGEPVDFSDASFDEGALPAEITIDTLEKYASLIAGLTLLARYFPQEGSRHDCQLALIGALVNDGWDEEEVELVVSIVDEISENDQDDGRAASIRTTVDRRENNENIVGWGALSKHYEKGVLGKIQNFLGGKLDPTKVKGPSPFTDMANAERLVTRFGESLRYVRKWNTWLYWNGRMWDEGEIVVEKYAQATVRHIYEEADKAEANQQADFGKLLRKHAIDSSDARKLANMIRLGRYQGEIAIRHTDLNKNTSLLNFQNGTLDVVSGQFKPHEPKDLLNQISPTFYEPQADCPLWKQAILEMMGGDKEVADFLQVAVGYSLTGCMREQLFFMLYGTGRNGKSTFLNVLQHVLGADYTASIPNDTLLTKAQGESHPTGLTLLFGKRLAITTEIDKGMAFQEGLIKKATGGDKIVARKMREDFWEFLPTHTVWMACNHKPRIQGRDEGIWRRVNIIPFEVNFEGREDPRLTAKLKEEAPGILQWALEGARRYLNNRSQITPPLKCAILKDAYKADQDRLRDFFEDCVEFDPTVRTTSDSVFKVYRKWCENVGEAPISRKAFAEMLQERGVRPVRTKLARCWEGIKMIGAISALEKAFTEKIYPDQQLS